MKAIILAAGEGRRMRPLTLAKPKPMIEVLGKPLLEHIIESLPSEITELILVVGYKAEQIKTYFGDMFAGRKITYVHQEKPEGTAQALLLCKKYLSPGERFLFLFADDLHSARAIQKLLRHKVGMLAERHPDPSRFGVIETDGAGRVIGFEEKPSAPRTNLVSPGVFVLDTRIFSYQPVRHESGEYFLTSQISQFISHEEMFVEETDFWHPIGFPEDIAKAESLLAEAAGTSPIRVDTLAVILAGGRGTRMPDAEKRLPKPLVEVAGKPILEHQIDLLKKQGFSHIRLSLGYRAEEIIAWLRDKQLADIDYVIEREPRGTGGGIRYAAGEEKNAFLVLNGDVLADFDFRAALRASGDGMYGAIAGVQLGDVSGMGVMECDEHKKICTFREKQQEKTGGLINGGLYVLRPDDVRSMPEAFSVEYDLFPKMAAEGKLVVHEHKGNYWFDCGTEGRLLRVREYFANLNG